MASDSENDGTSRSQSPEESGDQETGDMIKTESQDRNAENGDRKDKENPGPPKKSSNAKDPSRPRRKKARRACFACQRAHLTCGDERPCQRCIKRGLQDACQDGVRKKAKYLHDAPSEALLPGASTHYQYLGSLRQGQQNPQSPTYPLNPVGDVYAQAQTTTPFPVYNPVSASGQLPITDTLMNASGFGSHQSPISSPFGVSSGPQPNPMQSLVQAMESAVPPPEASIMQDFGSNIFDGQDLSQYNFDPASFNFGNHYGALEFGMLGHMSSGAAETPPNDTTGQMNPVTLAASTMPSAYSDNTMATQPYLFGQDQTLGDWRPPTQPQSNVRQQDRIANAFNSNAMANQDQPNAFSIGVGSAFASPTTEMSPMLAKSIDEMQSSKPILAPSSAPNSRPSTRGRSMASHHQHHQQQQHHAPTLSQSQPTSASTNHFPTSRHHHPHRRGDPARIYTSVTQPYSYTTGFHSLIAFIQKRFPPPKTLRIAKALASIRPSFLACTKSLGHEDLIFMEKCFQRTLWEYEDFISACGTPTIVCRRTGEVAAVGKEFSILTGWKKDVLLGKEANLNVNTRNNSSGVSVSGAGALLDPAGSAAGGVSGTGTSTGPPSRPGGFVTPRLPAGALDSSRPQPVFLAELLDDDSVIEFYEDFARLAFGDSRGGVTTRCKLLKYRSKEYRHPVSAGVRSSGTNGGVGEVVADGGSDGDGGGGGGRTGSAEKSGTKRKRTLAPAGSAGSGGGGGTVERAKGIAGEAGIDELGGKDGKVECSCCWTVKRDLFDLPMMIVMNFLPCI